LQTRQWQKAYPKTQIFKTFIQLKGWY